MKLLIADDEMQIRTGLEQGIDWNAIGIEEVFTAENGIEALQLCQQNKPELIITDIRMPGLSGIELSKKVSSLYQPVEIIILSGYSEFEYARQAIQFGAFDYLLKPVNIEDLVSRVQNAIQTIQTKIANSISHQAYLKRNQMRELQQIFESNVTLERKELKQLKEQIGIEETKNYAVTIVSIDGYQEKNREEMIAYISEEMEHVVTKLHGAFLFWEKGNLYCVLEVFTEEEFQWNKNHWKSEQEKLNKKLLVQYQNTISIAISQQAQARQLPILLSQGKDIIKHRFYLGNGVFIDQSVISAKHEVTMNPLNIEQVRAIVTQFNYELIHSYLKRVFSGLVIQKVTSIDFVRGICLELKNILLSVVSERGVDIASIFEHNAELLDDIPPYVTLGEYEKWIDNVFYLIFQGLSQLIGPQHSRCIVQAMDYISQNYAWNVSLETTAEYIHKSKNYFSYLFKKEVGITFIEYLNLVRIEQSKKLLDTTDAMTYEISEQVGYSDYKYFSKVFKKITGQSPAQYRKRKVES